MITLPTSIHDYIDDPYIPSSSVNSIYHNIVCSKFRYEYLRSRVSYVNRPGSSGRFMVDRFQAGGRSMEKIDVNHVSYQVVDNVKVWPPWLDLHVKYYS